VVATELEHHSNFVPWQYIARRTGAEFAVVPIDDNGELVLETLPELERRGRVKAVACALVSNTLGTVNPVEEVVAWAHARGAVVVVDACQAVPNRPVDVQHLDCDFLAFTGHKMCGPSGIGVLYGRRELLERMSPFELGGSMISRVTAEATTWAELPYKFEAGTPPIAEAYGLGRAVDYLNAVGLPAIERHEQGLTELALARLAELPYVRVLGPPADRRGGIVSFVVEGVHPHDVAQVLDLEGIAVRAGHHCTQPVMDHFGVAATTRASFYLYNLPEEIDRLVEGVAQAKRLLG
jgi:cysteine desulfurase/selenocysteine lyase